uniref:SURP and G-patch domain containing 2 n=1 Tax=Ficedula albicollis TaxID=59894 RepID=A0A803VTX8_FICAL
KENYFHGQFSRPAPRQREFGREYGRPVPQNREFGRGAVPSREYGQQTREYGQQNREYGQQNREYGQQNREYGRDRDYGQDYCWEGSGQHEPEFGSSDVLGDFRSPGLMEEEFGTVENQDYEEEEEEEFGGSDAEFRLRRGNVGRGRVMRGKHLTRGVVKPKGFKGDLKSPLKKWNVKKAQPGLEGKALEQPLDVAERPSGQRPLQQHPKVPPSHPLAAQRPILRLPKPAHVFRNLSFDLVDKSDIFSTFGIEIIKWAGFHAIKNDAEFSRLFGALFELETETCAKMLASFKCSLRPEHRDYCFFTIKSLQHAALKTPKVDNEFLNMLLDKGAVKTKNCFFEIIKPFDKYIMRLQDRLLKGVTPLLMACNAYELSIKTNGFGNPREMANAFETTVSLCRKSLALLGQTFALASVFRQEKILEAVGLQEMAPAPTAFPNFDDSTLFGREYIENLKAWLEKSGYPIQMKKAEAEPTEQLKAASPDSKGIREGEDVFSPQRADRKVLDTIEQLVTKMVSGNLSAQDRNAQKNCPEYCFGIGNETGKKLKFQNLLDQTSPAFKFYRMKVYELCPSITFNPEITKPSQRTPELSEEEEEEEEDDEDEEEAADLEPPQAAGEEDEDDVAAGRRVAQLEEDLLSRPAEEVAAGEGRLSSPSDGAAPHLSAQAPGAPFPRKRVSSKSLKVGMIPASKRICLIEEPKGQFGIEKRRIWEKIPSFYLFFLLKNRIFSYKNEGQWISMGQIFHFYTEIKEGLGENPKF